MKREYVFKWILAAWIVIILAVTALLTNPDQSVAGIIFEGMLWMMILILGSLLLLGALYAVGCLFTSDGRKGLREYAGESAARRKIKKAEKRARRKKSFLWRAFCVGAGFGIGSSIFNNHNSGGA